MPNRRHATPPPHSRSGPLLLALLGLLAVPSAQAAWTYVAPMAQVRFGHTSTLLQDGRVLVAGGTDQVSGVGPGTTTSTLYDPASDTWAPLPDMGTARVRHSATLLADGRVLVGDSTSAEVFDPASQSWTPTGPFAAGFGAAQTVLLPNGEVLATGVDGAQLYAPATNTWRATAPTAGKTNGYAALQPTGQAYVLNVAGTTQGSYYAPATDSWDLSGPAFNRALTGASIVAFANGNVLINGGRVGNTATGPGALYRASTRTWSAIANLTLDRTLHATVALPNDTAMLISGQHPKGGTFRDTNLYTVASNSWATLDPVGQQRFLHTATLLADGRVLIVGGTAVTANSAEVLDSGLPGRPSATATAGDAQALVQWTSTGAPATSFTVQAEEDASKQCQAAAPATSCSVTGLTNGSSYRFTVTPTGANGAGMRSLPSNAVTPQAPPQPQTPVTQVQAAVPGMSGQATVTLAGGGASCGLGQVQFAAPAGSPPTGQVTPGAFAFDASGCAAGSQLTLTLDYPEALPANVEFWKWGPAAAGAASTWFRWTEVTLSADRKQVRYRITDNGVGDSDAAPGRIADPLVPVVPTAAPSTSVAPVPGLSPGALAALAALLWGGLAWRRRGNAR